MPSPSLEGLDRRALDALRRVLVAATAAAGRSPDPRLPELIAAAPMAALPAAAALHRVGGCVHESLRDVPCVPADVLAALAAERAAATRAHLGYSRALAGIANVWDAAGVSWLTMKGPYLAGVVYGDPGLRTYGDLDVLVDRRALATAVETLEAEGYEHLVRDWPLAEWFAASEFIMHRGPVDIDLHWHLVYAHYDRRFFALDPAVMLARSRRVPVAGRSVPTFDSVDTLLHLCLHASKAGGHLLVWFKDIERAVAVERPDLDELIRRARAFRCGPPVGIALSRAKDLVGADVPDEVVAALLGPAFLGLERLTVRSFPPIRFDERDSMPRLVARSARSGLATSVADGFLRVPRAIRRAIPRRPHETSDPVEKAAFFASVAAARR